MLFWFHGIFKNPNTYCLRNTLRPRRDDGHFSEDIFKYVFVNDYVLISNKISLKFVPRVPNNNIPALVQIMAWHQPDQKPSSEPMMLILLTPLCVALPQWSKHSYLSRIGFPLCNYQSPFRMQIIWVAENMVNSISWIQLTPFEKASRLFTQLFVQAQVKVNIIHCTKYNGTVIIRD